MRDELTDDLPNARSTLRANYACLLVWCKACHHQRAADLQAIIDAGRGHHQAYVVFGHSRAKQEPEP